MKGLGIVLLLFFSFAGAASRAQERHVRTITVRSAWGGLGKPGRSDIVIQHEGNRFVTNGRIVRSELVDALLSAIEEPVLSSPSGANLGVTAQWLKDHADEAGKFATYFDYETGTPEQKDLFRSAFTNNQTIQRRLDSLYAGFHTDDYPHMRVELVLDDGSTVLIQSDSQHPFMIPWKVKRGDVASDTYNANISRALFALLPAQFTNRGSIDR